MTPKLNPLCIFASTHAIVMIFFVSNVFWVKESIPSSHKCVTFTDDLETQSHVIVYVTFNSFSCVCPRMMNFVLFIMFLGQ